MDEDDDIEEIIEIIEEEPVVVEATPWFNSDTVATSMMFASQLAEAAATHFHNLAMLSLQRTLPDPPEPTHAPPIESCSGVWPWGFVAAHGRSGCKVHGWWRVWRRSGDDGSSDLGTDGEVT